MTVEVKVTITTTDGEVLDTLFINGDNLEGIATHPAYMLAQSVKEVIEENFETREG
jgi:hypothetical protein